MNRSLVLILFCAVMCQCCYQEATEAKPVTRKKRFVYTETIVTGTDTGMLSLGGFRRINMADVLCQRWRLENPKEIADSLLSRLEQEKSVQRDVVLFKDSTAVLDPMRELMIGNWQVKTVNRTKHLVLSFSNGTKIEYIIQNLSSGNLVLTIPEYSSPVLKFSAPALVHQNMRNDPFHPSNNKWRLKPGSEETEGAIHDRVKNCLLFFALYYRDHIKRQAKTINFEGLPVIFKWYNGGIGLPDKEELDDSWLNCFYNKQQALEGYSILYKLIVDYEFNWPRGAPGWIYRTHSVLEQMYHKVDDIKE